MQGVDSTAASNEALEAGKSLALSYSCIVGISGAVDLITDGQRVLQVRTRLGHYHATRQGEVGAARFFQ